MPVAVALAGLVVPGAGALAEGLAGKVMAMGLLACRAERVRRRAEAGWPESESSLYSLAPAARSSRCAGERARAADRVEHVKRLHTLSLSGSDPD